VEGQERNTAQLERIEAAMKQKWNLKREDRKEESSNEERGSKNGSGESQEEETLLSASC